MALNSRQISLIIFLSVFATTAFLTQLNIIRDYFKLNYFHFTLVCLFIAVFAVFQLYFYSMIESTVPQKVISNLLTYFIKIIPDAKAKLKAAVTLTDDEYKKRVDTLKTSNWMTIKSSPVSLFITCMFGLAFIFLLIHVKPFTWKYQRLTRSDYTSIGAWFSAILIQLLLYTVIVQRHSYIYKTRVFSYGLDVLRKCIMTTVIAQASVKPAVASDDDLKKVSDALQKIVDARERIDLDAFGMPTIAQRLKDRDNRYVIVLACICVLVLVYCIFKSVVQSQLQSVSIVLIFSAVLSYYMWMYTRAGDIKIKTSLDDPDMLMYEIANAK